VCRARRVQCMEMIPRLHTTNLSPWMGNLLLGDMFQEMMGQVSNTVCTATATFAE